MFSCDWHSNKVFGYFLKEEYRANQGYEVIWLNQDSEGGFFESQKPYDFEIRDKQGNIIYYIDCKGTPKEKPTFYLTANEWKFFLNHKENYQIYRVSNFYNTQSDKDRKPARMASGR